MEQTDSLNLQGETLLRSRRGAGRGRPRRGSRRDAGRGARPLRAQAEPAASAPGPRAALRPSGERPTSLKPSRRPAGGSRSSVAVSWESRLDPDPRAVRPSGRRVSVRPPGHAPGRTLTASVPRTPTDMAASRLCDSVGELVPQFVPAYTPSTAPDSRTRRRGRRSWLPRRSSRRAVGGLRSSCSSGTRSPRTST